MTDPSCPSGSRRLGLDPADSPGLGPDPAHGATMLEMAGVRPLCSGMVIGVASLGKSAFPEKPVNGTLRFLILNPRRAGAGADGGPGGAARSASEVAPMPCSPAQLEGNRENALLSKGPTSPEGKAISRRNSLKHGLTGAGIVLPTDDEAEVARRFEALEAEMAPKSELARMLVNRVATLSLRMEHCVEHEAKNSAHRMRHATEAFDDQRLAEVEKTLSWIATEPATHARRLRGTPEGIDRLVADLERLGRRSTTPRASAGTGPAASTSTT